MVMTTADKNTYAISMATGSGKTINALSMLGDTQGMNNITSTDIMFMFFEDCTGSSSLTNTVPLPTRGNVHNFIRIPLNTYGNLWTQAGITEKRKLLKKYGFVRLSLPPNAQWLGLAQSISKSFPRNQQNGRLFDPVQAKKGKESLPDSAGLAPISPHTDLPHYKTPPKYLAFKLYCPYAQLRALPNLQFRQYFLMTRKIKLKKEIPKIFSSVSIPHRD